MATRNIASLLRPLTARSVVASTLLGMDPPRLSAAALVASGELFSVAPGTTRVALSRMVDAGELTTTEDGGYALAGTLLDRHARQEQGRHPKPAAWSGDWRVAVVTSPTSRTAASRVALRQAMGAMRMAELRSGVWLRPHNLPEATVPAPVAEQCTFFVAQPDAGVDATGLFALHQWALDGHELLAALARTHDGLRAREADALGETFVIAAATTRHLTLDPLLPSELLPRAWPGPALRRAYDAYQRDFAATWRAWYRSTV